MTFSDDDPDVVMARPLPGARGARRMAVLRRADGHLTLAEQYYQRTEYGGEVVSEGWRTVVALGLYADRDLAEAEVCATCPAADQAGFPARARVPQQERCQKNRQY